METIESHEETFARFKRKRQALNDRLDASRGEIDALLENHPLPLSMPSLATLEVILKERRELLAELVALDDQLMEQLVQQRTARHTDAV